MIKRRFSKLLLGLILAIIMIVGMASIKHPIVLKWLVGSARVIGKPIEATVYSNGQIKNEIKVFQIERDWNGGETDYFILHNSAIHRNKELKIFSINKKDRFIGLPSSTNIKDYDVIAGLLFQSEVGAKFTPFENEAKGYNFNTKLKFVDRQIFFNIPAIDKVSNYDSIRVEFSSLP